MGSPDVEKASLAELLERVAVELSLAARSVDDLHDLVDKTTSIAPQSESFIRKVQTIDLLQQHLAALSGFMRALSRDVPAGWMVGDDAANEVKLSRLRERLNSVGDSTEEQDHRPGDFHVF
jgi:hypothetical protein